MKQRPRARQGAFARLASINPVPRSERAGLAVRLSEIKPQLPQLGPSARRSQWKRPVIVLAFIGVLGLGGVAVAASWGPLSAIGAADRPAERTDTLSPAAKEMLRRSELGGVGGVDRIGSRLVEQARLLGELPDGSRVYAVPTSKGKLCIVVAESGASCGDSLTRERPVTVTASKVGPSAPHVVWGATVDDVVSVSFEVGGQRVTVPVENNFYAWEGQPTGSFQFGGATTVTFSDGTTTSAG